MTRVGGARRARVVLAALIGIAIGLSPAGSRPADAAKGGKPKPTTTTTTRPSTTTTSTTLPPQPSGAEAVTYHLNAVHSGSQSADPLTANLQRRWTRDLGGSVSYPVVAAGKVFVTVGNAGSYGTKLYAFDLVSGSIAWGPVDLGGTYWWSAAAYESGQVFVQSFDGVLRSFDAATGAQQWSVALPGQWAFTSPPTAKGGVVYTAGAGSGGTVYAVDARTGAVLWTRAVVNGDHSSPAVTETDVYVSYSCPTVHGLDRATGTEEWRYTDGCSGGGGKTAAVAAGGVWVRDFSGDIVLDPATGAVTGTFSAGPIPALTATTGFFLDGSTLTARDLLSGAVLWTFAGDGRLTSAPVTANGFVYVGSAGGNVYAMRATTGELVTTVNVGSAVPAPDEHNVSQPLTGLAIGLGHLVVPATNTLTVFGS